MNRLTTILVLAGLLTAPALANEDSAEVRAMEAEARQASQELVKKLGAALKQALAESGPEGAIGVCRDTAPQLAGSLSRRTGWKVGRVSLKTRNPLIGQPDTWEQGILKRFDEQAAGGALPAKLQHAEIVTEPEGKYFRYMKALPVKPLCLTCHGTDKTVPESVQTRLKQEYPNDKATGYFAGQIRGAVTIKRRLEDR